MGAQIIRTRRDKEYLYYAFYEGGKRKEIYCGPASNPNSGQRALQCEMEDLTRQVKEIHIRMDEIRKKMDANQLPVTAGSVPA